MNRLETLNAYELEETIKSQLSINSTAYLYCLYSFIDNPAILIYNSDEVLISKVNDNLHIITYPQYTYRIDISYKHLCSKDFDLKDIVKQFLIERAEYQFMASNDYNPN